MRCSAVRSLMCLVALAVLFGATAQEAAGAVLIDFETFPDGCRIPGGTRITDQFAPLGVATFATTDPAGPRIIQFGLTGQSGINALAGSPDFFQPITILFSAPVVEASILALDVGEAGLILEGFNSQSILVDSMSVTHPGDGTGQFDTLAVVGDDIVQLVVRQITPGLGGDGYAIDDLRFSDNAPAGERRNRLNQR